MATDESALQARMRFERDARDPVTPVCSESPAAPRRSRGFDEDRLCKDLRGSHGCRGAPELALDAAAELGEIAGDVRILKWMVGASIGLTLVMLAMLFQIALRLP